MMTMAATISRTVPIREGRQRSPRWSIFNAEKCWPNKSFILSLLLMMQASAFQAGQRRSNCSNNLDASFMSSTLFPLRTRENARDRISLTASFGISKWREQRSEMGGGGVEDYPIFMLPFRPTTTKDGTSQDDDNSCNDSSWIVQGQSKTIILKEGRHFDMIEDCLELYHGIIGMAYMGDDGLMPILHLCQITDDDVGVEAGFRGKVTMHLTLHVVSRARMVSTLQVRPTLLATCEEMVDQISSEDDDLTKEIAIVQSIEAILKEERNVEHFITYNTVYRECMNTALLASANTRSSADHSTEMKLKVVLSLAELTASSWAVFSIQLRSADRVIPQAIATTHLLQRLELGLAYLQDIKYGHLNNDLPHESLPFQ